MAKLKSNRGAGKRFRATANGYKHRATGRNHILTKKSHKRKVSLRGCRQVDKSDIGAVDQMLPHS